MFYSQCYDIEPLLESFYLKKSKNHRLSIKEIKSIRKSIKSIQPKVDGDLRWVFLNFKDDKIPILLKKSGDHEIMLTGPLSMKKAKTEKDLEYWKKKLLDAMSMEKSLREILFGDLMIKAYHEELLEKAKGYEPGTIREWSGKKYKKLSSGKWVLTYESTETRGGKQAYKNTLKKIQNATSVEELEGIIRDNKERFSDSKGNPLPDVKNFLDYADMMREEKNLVGKKEKKEKKKEKKEDKETVDTSHISDIQAEFYTEWAEADNAVTKKIRDSIMLNDGTLQFNSKNDPHYKSAIENEGYNNLIENSIKNIDEKELFRGTTNNEWLNVEAGDQIPTGMASFSKKFGVASKFSGDTSGDRIILKYSPPPKAQGIDFSEMRQYKSDERLSSVSFYAFEEEVAIRSKALKVKNKYQEERDGKTYHFVEVEVVPADIGKAIENEIYNYELSNDFNNPLSDRNKKDKELDSWKEKLISIMKEDVEKSLEDILFPGVLLKSLPDKVKDNLEKAKKAEVGTIREWSGGKKFKKVSSGKWMRVYEGAGGRGEEQAVRNTIKKINNASSMAELEAIVKDNKERFSDSNGNPLPVVKDFLDLSGMIKDEGKFDKKKEEKKKKPVVKGEKEKKSDIKYSSKAMDFVADWAQDLDETMVKETRNAVRRADGTLEGYGKKSPVVAMIDSMVKPIEDEELYRGTRNTEWLNAKPGDKIPVGMASFSKSEKVATGFTGSKMIILRYVTPPEGKGIDVENIKEDQTDPKWWDKRGMDMEQYAFEQEVAIRSKYLTVKEIRTEKLSELRGTRGEDYEYTIIDVVVDESMAKAIEDNKENLSDDFNNRLSDRSKIKEKKETEDKELSYWKKKMSHILEGDLIEKSLKDIIFGDVLFKSLSDKDQDLLEKARKTFPVGTKRTWSGKEYKKVAGGSKGKGKWVRTYSEQESRGAKQAIGNVRKKIAAATSMEELLEIVRQNSSRFQDDDGKMLPIVKEFLAAVRGTEAGKKKVSKKEKNAEKIVSLLKPKDDIMGFDYKVEDDKVTFTAEVYTDQGIKDIEVDPRDYREEKETVDVQADLNEEIKSEDFEAYGSWNPSGKHLPPKQREKLNQEIAELINKDFLTKEEQDKVRLYSGFGGTKVADEKGLLYDYYTSPPVAKMVFQAINKVSEIKAGNKVLEPSCGTGVFLDVAPSGLKNTGVEYDARTAKAADILQPGSDIETGSFEAFNLHSSRDYDVVIGNCPFGKRSVDTSFIDSDLDGNGKSISGEDTLDRYFISKSLDNLKPGGTMGMIAYSGIMNNATNKAWRTEMLRKGQFVGAMQLPNESFKHTQTGVSPDIYYFKKHSKEVADRLRVATEDQLKESGAWNEEWVNGGYYDSHPENRLGKKAVGNFGSEITTGKITDDLLNKAVANFNPEIIDIDVSNIPVPPPAKQEDSENVSQSEAAAIQAKTLNIGATKVINGIAYFLNANHRWERVAGQVNELKKLPELTAISLKVAEIRDAMQNDINPSNLQEEVRGLLEEYKESHGSYPNNDTGVLKLLKRNPTIKDVHESVNVTPDSGILNNQNIYEKDITITDGHQPDIVALKEIQKNLAIASPEVLRNMYPNDSEALEGLMIKNPDIFIDWEGNYRLREDFIAGDAWEKIDAMRKSLDSSDNKEKIQYGIDELEKAIGWVSIEDADFMPQSSWITEDVINQWAEETYDTTVGKDDTGKWDMYGYGSGDKGLLYYLNFKKQRGGSAAENDINTMEFNRSANESFKNFVATHEELRAEVEEQYNRRFNTELGVPNKTYNVDIKGWDKYTLNPWQWQTIHHLYERGKGISALGTGFGKTLAGVALMALLRQEGKIRRPLYQVPNNKVKDWLRIINAAMPGLKVGYVDPEEKGYSNRDTRYQMYQELANNEYDVLILPESSATEIQLSPEEDEAIITDTVLDQMPDLKTDAQREKAKESLKAKMVSGKKNQTITFEDLGVDALFVDEAHNYKNLYTSSLSRETGLNDGRRSDRALSFYKKTEYIRKNNDGKNVFMLTATPLTNSPLEYYNMLSHVAPEEFKKMNIKNINDFITNFADIEQDDVADWKTDGIVNKKVLKGFRNLRSLQDMFFKYTDLQNDPNVIGIEKPKPTREQNILPQDSDQVFELKELSEAMIKMKSKSKDERDPGENTLTYFSKMRTASLDLELFDPIKYAGWKNPKVEKMTNNAWENWENTDGGQVIFSDRVMSSDKDFNFHEKIKQSLVDKGFNPDEIAIVNGITKAGSSQSEKALQTKVSDTIDGFNSGKYKVVIGTTGTIGEGVNLQKNSAALHHIDIPYRPSDFIQRNGRIDRQGNKQKNVELHTYAASGTTDNYSIAKVSGKESWINELLNTKSSVFTNPDGEGFDMDEMMISLQGEWGRDTSELKKQVAEKKASKIKEKNLKARDDSMRKLSTVRAAITSYSGDKGSKTFQNMISKEAVYTDTLRNNPEFHYHELIDGERIPFVYDHQNKHVMKIGDYYKKENDLYKVENIDLKKGEVKFSQNLDKPYSTPSWTIKGGFSSYSMATPAPEIQTEQDYADFKTAVKGDFSSLNEDKQRIYYPDYIGSGYGSKEAFYLSDNEVTSFKNNDGVLLNPYVKEDLARINEYTDEQINKGEIGYTERKAYEDPSIPDSMKQKIAQFELKNFKEKNPGLFEQVTVSKEWQIVPEKSSKLRNILDKIGYETDYRSSADGYAYQYRRV